VNDPETMDDAIRELVRATVQATVEYCAERAYQGKAGLLDMRQELADEMADVFMECADEDPESPVHAVRSFAK